MIQFCEVETEHGCICYQLERKNVRNINLRIRTDASVYISAPKDVPESVVTQFVKRRSRYIAEAQQHFRDSNSMHRSLDITSVGKAFPFWGAVCVCR